MSFDIKGMRLGVRDFDHTDTLINVCVSEFF